MRGLVIGIDEAGYGPNLGPLLVGATIWEVPGDPETFDFWKSLKRAVRSVVMEDDRLHIADSKVVYQPARGIGELERSVLCLLGLSGTWPQCLKDLHALLCISACDSTGTIPWYRDHDRPVPCVCPGERLESGLKTLRGVMEKQGIVLRRVACDLVSEARFNDHVDRMGNKAAALTDISLKLLRSVWRPGEFDGPVTVLCDKHGGRNHYAAALTDMLEGHLPTIVSEGRHRSVYSCGGATISFEMKAERHLPVAAASLTAKYLRELSMMSINDFWKSHLPQLRETKGYPGDSRRYRSDIDPIRTRLGIPLRHVWRER